MNLASLLHAAAARHPDAPAVSQGETSWRYSQFAGRVAATAAFLRRTGARPSDRIGIAMHNSAGFLQLLYACWHAGLCAVPMNSKLHPREFAYILDNAGIRLCFASPNLYSGIRSELPRDLLVLMEADANLFDEMAAGPPMPLHLGQPTDPAWLFYTSGTTGRPKGATLTQRNLRFMTQAYYADIDALDERDTIVHAAPLSHGSGLYALAHIAKGSHNVITASTSFSPADMFAVIEQHANVRSSPRRPWSRGCSITAVHGSGSHPPQDHHLRRRADVRVGPAACARTVRPALVPGLRPGREPDDHHRAHQAGAPAGLRRRRLRHSSERGRAAHRRGGPHRRE
jgi:acyl-CoA synthetase (AMP-forming)/AMP-acid ligase II